MNSCVSTLSNESTYFQNQYRQYKPSLDQFLIRNGLRKSDVEDVAQEVWLKVWQKRACFDGANFLAWMLRIAKNYLVDVMRKTNVRNQHLQDLRLDLDCREPKTNRAAREDISEMVQSSDNVYFHVLHAQLAGEPVSETASRLGVTRNTIYSRRHRGKRLLIQLMSE